MNCFNVVSICTILFCNIISAESLHCLHNTGSTCKVISKSIELRKYHAIKPKMIDTEINSQDVNPGIKEAIRKIRPDWNSEGLQIKELDTTYTDTLFGVWDPKRVNESDKVVVRIDGRNVNAFLNRKEEIRNLEVLSKEGYGLNLYAVFKNGVIKENFPGNTLTQKLASSIEVYPKVAIMMALIHKVNLPRNVPKKPVLWHRMQTLIDLIPNEYSDSEKQKKYEKVALKKDDIMKEFKELRPILESLQSPVMFCHNDLWFGAIVYDNETGDVSINDYQYSNYNYEAFEFGNHFSEHADVEGMDFSRLPDDSFMRDFITKYLKIYNGIQCGRYTCIQRRVDKYEVEKILIQSKKFILAVNLMWGSWGLVQANNSLINFDYFDYSNSKLKEYKAKKEEYLSIPYPPDKSKF